MNTCKKCNNQFPLSIKINGEIFDLSKRKYCLACYKLSKRGSNETIEQHERFCSICRKTRPIGNFLYLSRQKRYMWRCRQCSAILQAEKIKKFKLQCIEYKGGKCQVCGYNKSLAAMDFHHRNETKKEFNIGNRWYKKIEVIKDELDKCDLLCANCHREEHERLNSLAG